MYINTYITLYVMYNIYVIWLYALKLGYKSSFYFLSIWWSLQKISTFNEHFKINFYNSVLKKCTKVNVLKQVCKYVPFCLFLLCSVSTIVLIHTTLVKVTLVPPYILFFDLIFICFLCFMYYYYLWLLLFCLHCCVVLQV